jgi:hypothetical protein
MSNKLNLKTDPSKPTVYQNRIKGHLGSRWIDWFGGLSIRLEDNGDTHPITLKRSFPVGS